jgi:N6-adenosine-specific RNA methylase IME4
VRRKITKDSNPFPNKKYRIILADPPWNYNDKANAGNRGASHKYETQSDDWIMNLPVPWITDDNAFLFLWVTMPKLQEGLDTVRAWGFEYKTVAFNWIKKDRKANTLFMGMGNWTRSNSELCLLGIKGNPDRINKSVHSVVVSRIREHSRKPDEVRDRIVRLCGNISRIELFAREHTPGWDVFGKEHTLFDEDRYNESVSKINEEFERIKGLSR